jgi:hypothetical protein
MKTNISVVAALAVVLALFGVSSLPKKETPSGSVINGTSKSSKTVDRKSPPTSERTAACSQIRKRLLRYSASPNLPGSCYEDGKAPTSSSDASLSADMKFVIAIVPNPVTTHLSLFFDRQVEIIQQAAQDEFYSYDSSWLPWDDTQREYELLADQLIADREKSLTKQQPGILVFHSPKEDTDTPYQHGLLVFLVGEQPTGGIDDPQFENAIQWIKTLAPTRKNEPLNILGPTFSGSLPSLARELVATGFSAGFRTFRISSGSVSSQPSVEGFRNFLRHNKTQTDLGTFQTFMESDSIMITRFCKFLRQEGYGPDRLAILSEDETAFGSSGADGERSECDVSKGGPIYLYYPRDIAALRSAYEQQSIFNSAKQASSQSQPSTTLRGDLSEPASSEHDTVRTYAGQLTPLAQESILLGIAKTLTEKNVQFVVLRSSNSLDQIFLSQFLRMAYPSGRIVIDGSDLLFSRGAEGASLRGVMMLSNYPLIRMEQDWTAPLRTNSSRAYRVFGQDVVEGLYVAARDLLKSDHAENTDLIPIRDYSAPAWAVRENDNIRENQHSSTWLSVIGHRQFWPVAALNANTIGIRQDNPSKRLLSPIENTGYNDYRVQHLPFDMIGFLVICLAWSAWHLVCYCRGSINGFSSMLACFAPLNDAAYRRLTFIGSLLMGMLAVVIGRDTGAFSDDLAAGPKILLISATAVILVVSWLSYAKNLGRAALYAKSPGAAAGAPPLANKDSKIEAVSWLIAVIALLAVACYLGLLGRLTVANRFPTYWRSLSILSGVSPLLPQILLIAGFYGWFWFSLQGLALFGEDRPLLPKDEELPKLDGVSILPMFSREDAGDPIESAARPLTTLYSRYLAGIFGLVALLVLLALQGVTLGTLGDRRFGVMILVCLSLSIALVLANTVQLLQTWSRLRRLLVFLDRLPLRRTLAALKGLCWGTVWKMSGNVLEERYRVISRQFESLRHLSNLIGQTPPEDLVPTVKEDIVARLKACSDQGGKFAKWYVSLKCDEYVSDLTALKEFQEKLAETAGYVMDAVILPAWQKETESLIFDRSYVQSKKDKPEKDAKQENVIPVVKVPSHVQAAEEFFVLPYLGFIQNILGRIRTIVLGSLCVFVFATFSVSSYPFDPLPVLAGIFIAVFLLAGATMTLVYASMHRNATLSYITNTEPGQLGSQFWFQLFTFGVGPLLGLLTTIFPSISDFVVSWLQPSMQSIK